MKNKLSNSKKYTVEEEAVKTIEELCSQFNISLKTLS